MNALKEQPKIEEYCLKCRKPIHEGEMRQRITREIVFCVNCSITENSHD